VRFGDPTLLWLVLLAPAAAVLAVILWRRRLRAMGSWAAPRLWARLGVRFDRHRWTLSIVLLALAVFGTALALAQPRWGVVKEKVQRKGLDVVYVLDASLSMAAADAPPSRMEVAKTLIRRLTEKMPNNRVGLVFAAGDGVVMTPLTTDSEAIDLLLETAQPGSLPSPGTRLASGIDQALKLFPEGSREHRAIILVSDGEDHGGGLERTLTKLNDADAMVCAIGVGTAEGAPIPLPGASAGTFKRNEQGRVVVSRLEEANLEELTRGTGGVYLRATSLATDPAPILNRLARLNGRLFSSETVTTRAPRFQWPLALAAGALILWLGIGAIPSRSSETGR